MFIIILCEVELDSNVWYIFPSFWESCWKLLPEGFLLLHKRSYFMPCFSPLQGYKSRSLTKNGLRNLVFSPKDGFLDLKMRVPCGQCKGCRLDSSRQKAIRVEHEVQTQFHMHGHGSCFITLTYRDEDLHRLCAHGSLVRSHYSDFIKRLRRRLTNPKDKYFVSKDLRIKSVYCGEYGDKNDRPHFHGLIFGYDFPDKYHHGFSRGKRRDKLYRSDFLEQLWPHGYSSIGSATFESGAYVARYVMKKITGPKAKEHYLVIDHDTGECFERVPPFISFGNGIGLDWFKQYALSDVYLKDEVITKSGKRMKPPRYYDNKFKLMYPEEMERLKAKRIAKANLSADDNTFERLIVREKVLSARISSLKRDLG